MLKRTILAGMFFLFLGAAGAYAQFPAEGVNYQAVARNAQGNVISSPITVRISILSGSPTGTLQYQETHNTTPNSLGLFNLSIGQGFFLGGAVNSFSAINWGSTSHYAKTEINTGSGYTDMGTTQLWAVPYALYAKNAGNGGGGSYTAGSGIGISNNVISAVDNSVTNEIQSLSLSGSSLSISNGNTVTLPSGGTTYTAGTGISISGNIISATGGTTYTAGSGISISGGAISAVDNSVTNELQTLSLSGNTLSIANGNNVTLPTGTTYTAGSGIDLTGNIITATDNSITNELQTLSLSGNTLSIANGNNVTLPTGTTYTAGSGIDLTGNVITATDNSITNELQTLSLSGNTLSIANGNNVTLPTGTTYTAGSGIDLTGNVITATDNSITNELQTLTLSGNTLSISNGNNITLPTGTTYTAGAGITITGGAIEAADVSATNEIQNLSISGNTLSISGGNNITLPTGGGTLDQAYDFGGVGAGKTITADSGPVTINGSGTGAGNIGLLLTHNGTNTAGMGINFSGTGNGIQAISTNATNTFATIQASTNSSNINNSAILGQSTGAARAVTGQVEATATADVAVRGLNSRTGGGIGVEGVGYNGVSGATSQLAGVAVFGSNTATGATGATGSLAIGTYGAGFNGVFGQTTNTTFGYAGYFTADIGVEGTGYSLGGWQTASDRRLKTNIVPISGALDKIMMLQGTHYTITTKTSGMVSLDGKVSESGTRSREQYGVIAQDIEKVFPEMVSQKALFANQGDNTVYKTVDYIQIVPVLIEAIKELKLEVEALKAQIKQ